MIGFLRRVFLLFLPVVSLQAQNLAPNPSFETFNACPVGINIGLNLPCVPWTTASLGTSDYFNSCASALTSVSVPNNFFGYQYPYTGEAYCGFFAGSLTPPEYREYLQAPLIMPLNAGKIYSVSFYVSLANHYCGIEQLGAYFSDTIPAYDMGLPLNVVPQIESSGSFLNDTVNWTLIKDCFVAKGGETYVTIGNFHPNADTPLDPACNSPFGNAYYYIDEIYIAEIPLVGLALDLGGPVTVCDSFIIDPAIAGVQYLWEDSSTSASLKVVTSGTYSLTIDDGCQLGIDSIDVVIVNMPPVELNINDTLICQGQSVSFSLDPAAGQYVWNDGSMSSNYTITTSGLFEVTLDDGCDLTTDQINVMVMDPPSPFSLGSDTVLCSGTQIELDFNPTLGNFIWQDGSTADSFIIQSAGAYAVTISNICGAVSDDIDIVEVALPLVDLGADDVLLCNGDFLDFSLDPALGIYVWQDGSMTSAYHITNSGLYAVTLTNVCGQAEDAVQVEALSTPMFQLGDTLSICPGDMIMLAVPGATGNFEWQDGSTDTFFLVDQAQAVMLTISNACGVASDTLIVLENAFPDVDLGPDVLACEGEVVTLVSNISGMALMWQDGSTDSLFVTSTSGLYYLQAANNCGMDRDTVDVDIHGTAPLPALGPDTVLCEGTTLTLISAGDAETNSTWQDGSVLPTFLVTSPGMYILMQTNRCGADADSILITYLALPVSVDLGPDTILCPGELLSLTAPVTADQITWQDGSTLPGYEVNQAGSYSLTLSNKCGISADDIEVGVDTNSLFFRQEDQLTICPLDTILLDASQSFSANYSWSTGSALSSIMVTTPGLYIVTVDSKCQEATHEIQILPEADCEAGFFIPNVITPNGDNINDLFTLYPEAGIDMLSLDGSIFDRWGNLVFTSKEIPFTWDTRFGEQEMMAGVYVYRIAIRFKAKRREFNQVFTGDVTVIK